MLVATPGTATAATGNHIVLPTSVQLPSSVHLSPQLAQTTGTIDAFIQIEKPAALEASEQAKERLDRLRSAVPESVKESQAAAVGERSARQAVTTADDVFEQLRKLDGNAVKLYSTGYSIAGLAVRADAEALRTLSERSGDVLRVSLLPVYTVSDSAVDTPSDDEQASHEGDTKHTQDGGVSERVDASVADESSEQSALPSTEESGKQAEGVAASHEAPASDDGTDSTPVPEPQLPANANSDQLVKAVNTWQKTQKTGAGVNIAIMDTGFDYTHADFGGKGTKEAYETALKSTANPLTDPTLKTLLDANKYKGGYDFAGANYDGMNVMQTTPDDNPIDGPGGHHGTHVAGTAAGYGVTRDGKTFTGDYTKLTNADVADMAIGPGSAPQAGVYALKVFGDNGGSTGLVLKALDWVAEHNLQAKAADRISIVSMSLGGSFGTPDDPENVAVDTLSKTGVLSVIAAGNEGDVTDITGSPGTAASALTVAASQSGKALQDAVGISAAGMENKKVAGQYSSSYGQFDTLNLTSQVVRVKDPNNLDGCAAYSESDKAAVKGKIAFVDWKDDAVACGSKVRFDKAQEAGAVGIMFASQANIPAAGIAGNATLPGFQLARSVAEDPQVVKAIDDGTLQVHMAGNLRLSLNADYSRESEDTIAPFTSRGLHGFYDGTVKPDVAAPGVGIVSASAGSGTSFEVMSGTSMATPLTSGVTALVKQAHPEWQAQQIKTQLMNTADHDVLTADRTRAYGPMRVGTGRIDAYAAVNNDVQVSSENATAVTGQFGMVLVPRSGYSQTKTFTVTNMSDRQRVYNVEYSPRTETPGVTYTLNTKTVTVPAKGTAQFTVTLSIPDQSLLRHTRDVTQTAEEGGKTRSYVTDASGVVTLTEQGAQEAFGLRVAVAAAPKPVSDTHVEAQATAAGEGALRISGAGLHQGEGAEAYIAKAYPMMLGAEDPADAQYGQPDQTANHSLAAADIRAVGQSSTAPQLSDPSQGMLNIGIVTQRAWNRLGNLLSPMVIIDSTGDGKADYVMTVNTKVGRSQTDTVWTTTYNVQGRPAKVVDEQPIDDAFISDSNAVVLSVKLSALGFTAQDQHAKIQYSAVTQSRYAANSADEIDGTVEFDAYHPQVWFGDAGQQGEGTSAIDDVDGATIAMHAQPEENEPSTGAHAKARAAAEDPSVILPSVLTIHSRAAAPTADIDPENPDAVSPTIDIVDPAVEHPVDKEALQQAVDQANGMQADGYTEASWAAFAKALDAARAVLADDHASQQDVDAALNALAEARAQLAPRQENKPGQPEQPANPGQSAQPRPTVTQSSQSGAPLPSKTPSRTATSGSAVLAVLVTSLGAAGLGAALVLGRRIRR